jgi:hypothetical protein
MRSIRLGDIIYIKSSPQIGLIIKAVGVVRKLELPTLEHGAIGVGITWLWTGPTKTVGKIADAYNVRSNTLYEEHSPAVCELVLNLLVPTVSRS